MNTSRRLTYTQLTLNSFEGGITDRYVAASPNKYKKAENLIIANTGPRIRPILKIRPGSRAYTDVLAVHVSNARPGTGGSGFATYDKAEESSFLVKFKETTAMLSDNIPYILEPEIVIEFDTQGIGEDTWGDSTLILDVSKNNEKLIFGETPSIQYKSSYLGGETYYFVGRDLPSPLVEGKYYYVNYDTSWTADPITLIRTYTKFNLAIWEWGITDGNIQATSRVELVASENKSVAKIYKRANFQNVVHSNTLNGTRYFSSGTEATENDHHPGVFAWGGSESMPSFSVRQEQLYMTSRGGSGAGNLNRPVKVYKQSPTTPSDSRSSRYSRWVAEGIGLPIPTSRTHETIVSTTKRFFWDGKQPDGGSGRTIPGTLASTDEAPSAYMYAAVFSYEYSIYHQGSDIVIKNYGTPKFTESLEYQIREDVEGEDPYTDSITIRMPENPRLTQEVPYGGFGISTSQYQEYYDSIPLRDGNQSLGTWSQAYPAPNENRFKYEIYRTTNGGTSFFLVGERWLDDGGSSMYGPQDSGDNLVDTIKDSDLINQRGLYTNGGNQKRFNPPRCRYLTVVGDLVYYGNGIQLSYEDITGIKTEAYKPHRLWQSIPNAEGMIGEEFWTDLDDSITGLSSIGPLPLVFTNTYIYRIEGFINGKGQGSVRKKAISEYIGCPSHNSIIKTNGGTYFMGNDGFYKTDGYTIHDLTQDLKNSFAGLKNKETCYAAHDVKNDMIYWAVCENGDVNNAFWVLNTLTGGFTTTTLYKDSMFNPVSVCERDGDILRADANKAIYLHSESLTSDAVHNSETDFPWWYTDHIPFEFLSIASDLGSAGHRKWVRDATFTVKTKSTLGLLPYSNNDDSARIDDMKEIRHEGTITWGDTVFIWGDPTFNWRASETVSNVRRFPRGHMRCRRKQIGLKPSFAIRLKSDNYAGGGGLCAIEQVDATNFIITLDPDGSVVWPSRDFLRDGRFYFSTTTIDGVVTHDNSSTDYTHSFAFDNRINDIILTVKGVTLSELVGSTYTNKWVFRTYDKFQQFELAEINIRYAGIPNVGGKFQLEEEGLNE